MPELPDITVYLEALEQRIMGQRVEGVRVNSPFVLRTFEPPLEAVEGKTVRALRRLGKRIAIGLEEELWLVVHLMIAGRLHWKPSRASCRGSTTSPPSISRRARLLLTEAGTKRRASLHLLQGETALASKTRAVWRSSRRRSTPSSPPCASGTTRSSGP